MFELENKMGVMLGTLETSTQTAEQGGMLAFVTSFVVMSILASLYFMWSIRHSKVK
jgi:hypothetical protein